MKNVELKDIYNNIGEYERKYADTDKPYVSIEHETTGDCVMHDVYVFPNRIKVCDVLNVLNIDISHCNGVYYYDGEDRTHRISDRIPYDDIVRFVIDHDGWGYHNIDIFI